MKLNINENNGFVSINKEVLAQIAHQSVMESYGFVGFGYKERGIVEILKGENLTKGVTVEANEDGSINAEVYVIVQYGVNIETVASNLIEKIKYNIESMTSLKVNDIVVNVQGVRVK